ncbi:YafY family protein [Burkholderia sp. Ac-20353]|uniref:helix-turn-helix transcriptional regulator n=1 Tax=Burkholderia sp. Ac-20353 TaxID=2703894 RepID=UPI00197BE2EC|nr:YafY family protein [Burkholderia sp. Ac-20353]MBN3790351.1 YafY family transcriptional regulator [Burkholderia sp. Ac-20353]
MTRSERLLSLLQALRRHHGPVSGRVLAQELGISLRTLYRDIASLQAQGADIQGEPGIGYVLHPGYMLPPLMFSQSELEALTLGFRWVAKFADVQLTSAASDALAKISAVLPAELRRDLDSTTLLVGPRTIADRETVDMDDIRRVIRTERKLRVTYADARGRRSERTVWPFALGYFDDARILVTWCELRNDFRHFRTDRIVAMERLDERYPRRRAALLKAWREAGADVRVPA